MLRYEIDEVEETKNMYQMKEKRENQKENINTTPTFPIGEILSRQRESRWRLDKEKQKSSST